jgi:hypothetical protein
LSDRGLSNVALHENFKETTAAPNGQQCDFQVLHTLFTGIKILQGDPEVRIDLLKTRE